MLQRVFVIVCRKLGAAVSAVPSNLHILRAAQENKEECHILSNEVHMKREHETFHFVSRDQLNDNF